MEHRVERDPGRVRDAVDDVERRDHGADVDEGRGGHERTQRVALAVKALVVVPEDGIREGEQARPVLDATVARDLGGDRAQVYRLPGDLTARTEQCRVGGGSVEALVQRRDACRDQLHLRPVERAPHGRVGDLVDGNIVRLRRAP